MRDYTNILEKWYEQSYQSFIKSRDSTDDDEELSSAQKDRLSIHIRQDVAMAFYAAADAYKEARSAKVYAKRAFLAALISNAMLLLLLLLLLLLVFPS